MENKKKQLYITVRTILGYFLAVTLLLFLTINVNGRNFYFSTSTGVDSRTSTQAQSPATPWKTISKLNSFFTSLLPGDSILFKRGEVFYGAIQVGKSGTSSLPIIIAAYGIGTNPVISGLATLTSWTSIGNGIYESTPTTCKPTLNMVVMNGVQKAIGRYPNTEYLKFETHVGSTSITDNQLTGTPNWTGAEVVIRKTPYILGRNPINNHSGSTINYSNGGTIPKDNFGYFIQKDIKTLDVLGEWYLNPTSKKLQMYFGSSNPNSFVIKASTLDTLVYCNGRSYITFYNLSFEGANYAAFFIASGQNISIQYCKIDFSGTFGIYGYSNSPNLKIENSTINHSNHKAIQTLCANTSIRNNVIKNTGIIHGMGNEVGGYSAIELQGGDGTVIEYNQIDSTGYNGVFLRGNNVTVKNNLINYFLLTLDDGGGVYTAGKSFTGRKIIGNIILNGIGEASGTNNPTYFSSKGIFLDEPCSGVEITGNTVANCAVAGLNCNNTHDISVKNNLFYNNKYQINFQHSSSYPNDPTRNVEMKNNVFFSKTADQYSSRMYSVSNDVKLFGTADSNYYCRPIDDNNVIVTTEGTTTTNRTLANWQSFTGQDLHSKKSPQTISNINDLLFEYNASTINKVIPLNAVYVGVDGTIYTSSITLLPYKSAVLIKSASQNTNQAPNIQNQNFQINENSANSTTVGTVVATDPNVGQTLTYSIISGNTNTAFAIGATSGILTVANSAALNFETTSLFSLVVKVQDNGTGALSSQATITVTVINLNEAPVINNQSFSVAENSANGTNVGSVIASDPDAGQTKTFSIVSGNTGTAFSINAATGVLTVASSSAVNFASSPIFNLVVKVQDNGVGNLSSQATITINVLSNNICTATGNITYQVWNNIGSSVLVSSLTSNVNYPNFPSSTTIINSMEGTTNLGDNLGARIAGYICAPFSGNYTFWIAGDDNCELWLSTNSSPTNKQKIAFHNGFTWIREWNKYTTQKSAVISLTQGQSYYIEALMKEATGGDNFSVGWLKPGQTGTIPSEVIPGSVLSPITANQTILVTSVSIPSTSNVNPGSSATLSSTVLPINATNKVLNWTTSNPLIATVNSTGVVTGITSGVVTITASSTDGSNISNVCTLTVLSPPCTASGNIAYQIWNNIGSGVTVSSLTSNINYPDNPTSTTLISSMEGTSNLADSFGARIAGYICAPSTGSYTFWISGDDNCELWLSTNNLEANKQKIAYHTGFTWIREWNKYATQKSAVISLIQGQSYYIEALMKDATGIDNFAVGWLKPGQSGTVPSEVVPGSVLSPIVVDLTVFVTSVSIPTSASVDLGSSTTLLATVLPENATNSALVWISSNPAVASVNSDGLVIGVSSGTANITATSTDGSNVSDACTITVIVPPCSATGNISYQVWNNIGNSVLVSSLTSNVNYPNNPSSTTLISSMEGTTNLADNYGTRIAGYICAPSTGNYTFWVAGDDNCELWLSTNAEEINKQKIAYHNGFTWIREWNKYATQKSAVIPLVQGQSYYIEALMKESTGIDNFSVGWLKPGQSGIVPSEVIPGTVLSPIGSKSTEVPVSDILSLENVKMTVYPNPLTGDVLNIKIEDATEEITIRIYSATGILVYEKENFSSEAINLDRNIFKNGIYIIKVFSNSFTKTTKLIVK
jgi:uncharacterized protein YjdB